LRVEDILASPQPLLIQSVKHRAALARAGLESLDSLRREYGSDKLLFAAGDLEVGFLSMRRFSVDSYVDKILRGQSAHLLPESGGREFFLAHPTVYEKVAYAFSKLLPLGFREMLDVSTRASLKELARAARDADFGVSDLALWLGGAGHVRALHVDNFSGVLLTHLEGRKRLWLYPESQQSWLYLGQDTGNSGWGSEAVGWGAASRVPVNISGDHAAARHPERFPAFEHATPLVVELRAGESLFIPCGWAHLAQYLGPSMSISTAIHPDWLERQLKEKADWEPRSCASWNREPCDGDGCGATEL